MKNKKLCSLFLAIILMFNMTAVVPFEVFAETGTHTYNYDSYTVEYAVLNEWEGNQSIQVTIQNTGTESILNWALAYHAGGEVNGLWNAVSPKENIIKNAGYNYEIAPGQSVSFGYTLSGENFVLKSCPKGLTLPKATRCSLIYMTIGATVFRALLS